MKEGFGMMNRSSAIHHSLLDSIGYGCYVFNIQYSLFDILAVRLWLKSH
jgi:hypothetical protein